MEQAAEDAAIAQLQFITHIHHMPRGQPNRQGFIADGCIAGRNARARRLCLNPRAMAHNARRQMQIGQVAALRPIIRLKIRGGAAQNDHTVLLPHEMLRDRPRMVIGRVERRLMLVAVVVLFIQDDETNIWQRGK